VKAIVPLVAAPSGELDESPLVRGLPIDRCDDHRVRFDASGLGAAAGPIGTLAAAAVRAARSRMAEWRLDHGLERSSTASVQITLFGRPDCTGTLRLSTAMARRSEGRGFCEVRIAEDSGRRAGLATVVLAAGRPAPSHGPVDAHEPAFDGHTHEGAVLTLINAAATRAVRAASGSERRVFAVSLHASVSRPLPTAELSARAAIRTCDGQSAWCDVEVVGLADRRLYGVGTTVALI
jgi:hypothetical protein